MTHAYPFELTELTLHRPVRAPLRLAVAADLHNRPGDAVADALRQLRPDVIAIPGDLFEQRGDYHQYVTSGNGCAEGLRFLRMCTVIAPTCYAPGNHDIRLRPTLRKAIRQSGTHLLRGEVFRLGEYCFGGFGTLGDPASLQRLAAMPGFRILLCHHPEYYPRAVRSHPIDLTLAGHAHGGQWRFFGQGIYAPGQGLFPRYTSGFYDNGRLLVSRGLCNHTPIPRLWNRPELILLAILPSAVSEKT